MSDIENLIKKHIGKAQYDNEYGGTYIWGTNQKGEHEMIAQIPQIKENRPVVSIRGWGSIQYMKLPCKPEEFQYAIGKFVAEAINEKLEKL